MAELHHKSATVADRDTVAPNMEAAAIKAVGRVFTAWGLGTAAGAKLLGVSDRTWLRMKANAWNGALSDDQLTRASAIIGVYKGLHLYFGEDLADRWVTLPNGGPLFQGVSPAAFMADHGLLGLVETRNYIDAIRGGV